MNWVRIRICKKSMHTGLLTHRAFDSKYRVYPNNSLYRNLYPDGYLFEGNWIVLRFFEPFPGYSPKSNDTFPSNYIIGEDPKSYNKMIGEFFKLY